jgi:hypothetical protein
MLRQTSLLRKSSHHFLDHGFGQLASAIFGTAKDSFEGVAEFHQILYLDDDALLARRVRTSRPRTITLPTVSETSSRTWLWMSHPARSTAGVMSLVQMSRSDRSFMLLSCPPGRSHGIADRGDWGAIFPLDPIPALGFSLRRSRVVVRAVV